MDYTTLTSITEAKLKECAEQAASAVQEVEFKMFLDMGHGIWQLWLALAGEVDREPAKHDMDRLYKLIEPEAVSGLRSTRAKN